MSGLVDEMKAKIRSLEKENLRLKKLLDEAGIAYEVPIYNEKESITTEQCRLFFSYFWGRTDVYAKRYVNRNTGASGYFPQCRNFWRYGVCPKAERKKVQCKDCENKAWKQLGSDQIKAHLQGKKEDGSDVIGVYPLMQDGTCRFLVFDFDNHDADNDDLGFNENDLSWKEEVNAMSTICRNSNIPVLVEKSRSGKGAHIWIFFEKAIPASMARQFGFALLDKGAESVNLTSFRFYDRLLPAQDELKSGGLGNLIALPLQGKAVKRGNSVFVDDNWIPFPNQWEALTSTHKLSDNEISSFIEECNYRDASNKSDDDKPWGRKMNFYSSDVEDSLNITLSNCIYINKNNIKPRIQNQLRRMAAVSNPAFFRNSAMGLSNFNNPRYIYMGYDDGDYLCLPRGIFEAIEKNAKAAGINLNICDERSVGDEIKVEFIGELRVEQQRAVDSVKNCDIGIISAATAFGQTVMCCKIIASRKVNTLILIESSALIEQWENTLERFLDIDQEIPEYATPTGRIKRRKSHIGIVHGAKDTSTGIIDIAMVGSLKKKGEFHERLKSYGMIIVDECHHSASNTMSDVLMEVNAKYVYGVTATPFRGDGLGVINNMLLGPIRFQYTTKERAISQGIDYIVVPRFTRVVNPHWSERTHINDAYEAIRSSNIRNEQICDDIRKCISEGRTPVVLSRYKEHAEQLYEAVKDVADKVFLLTGSKTKKEHIKIREDMNAVSDDETMILVATGKLVGEGFDFPRLDTLIMATPVSFKGVVEQYAGRLNRDYPGKERVVIFDYIDSNIRVFDNMYAKRLKAYKRIGYSLQTITDSVKQEASSIFDYESYLPVYNEDLKRANDSIVISSPTMRYNKVISFVNDVRNLQEKGVKITIITWTPDLNMFSSAESKIELIEILRESGIEVITRDDYFNRFSVIDNAVVWYGSINFLGKEDIEDNIMRVDSKEVAAEVLQLLVN